MLDVGSVPALGLGTAPPPPTPPPPGRTTLVEAALASVDILVEPLDTEPEADVGDMLAAAVEETLAAASVAVDATLSPMPLKAAVGAAMAPVLRSVAPPTCRALIFA